MRQKEGERKRESARENRETHMKMEKQRERERESVSVKNLSTNCICSYIDRTTLFSLIFFGCLRTRLRAFLVKATRTFLFHRFFLRTRRQAATHFDVLECCVCVRERERETERETERERENE